jgi:hypothetical protein
MKNNLWIYHKDKQRSIIKDGDQIMVTTANNSKILLKARFHKTQQKWFFYTHDVVGFTWEDLLLPQVVSIEIVPKPKGKDKHKQRDQ